jgi:hypothetical protein
MKSKIAASICIIIFGLICCHKEDTGEYKSAGKIIGPDYRMCSCCGGWYIEIDSVIYEFDTLPDNSDINLQEESFPLPVKLDWQISDKAACPDKRIIIQRIKKK